MDFFEAQERAKRRTGLLLLLFAAALAAIILAVYLAVVVAMGAFGDRAVGFDAQLLVAVAVGTGLLVGLGSLFRMSQLRGGGPSVASLLGGKPVDPATTDPGERQLMNVVEEIAIAAGMPVPAVFVLPGESGINAFAAGYTIHDAAVAVTEGTLESLDREELEGVVAHEFSHILNGDMRLNVRLIGLLFGLLLLAIVGRGLLRGAVYSRGGMRGRRQRGSGGQIAVLGVALLVVGYIGVLFGKLIKAAVSRQREFLADAAAVQFTRNPRGLASALARIGGGARGSRIEDHHAEELSHLFFANGVGGALSRLMATHPPLDERIRRIDASLADELVAEEAPGVTPSDRTDAAAAASVSGLASSRPTPYASPNRLEGVSANAAGRSLLASVGAPGAAHMDRARQMLREIPSELREAVREPVGASAVIVSMLGGHDSESRAARRNAIRRITAAAPEGRKSDASLVALAEALTPELRLSLVDLALPALHRLEPDEVRTLRQEVRQVVGADGNVRTFDFALIHILWRHLPDSPPRRGDSGNASLSRLRSEAETVLSALARFGHETEEGAKRAFDAGTTHLSAALQGLQLQPAGTLDLQRVDAALVRLERASLEARRRMLEGAVAAVLQDGEARTAEVEMLRAIAASLELPLPPLVTE